VLVRKAKLVFFENEYFFIQNIFLHMFLAYYNKNNFLTLSRLIQAVGVIS